MTTTLEKAFSAVRDLAGTFEKNKQAYLGPDYSEAQARKDFVDKFFIALGWDVNHDIQTNPYEQEVKVEPPVTVGGTQRHADYAFRLSPNFNSVCFFVEAKKPSAAIKTKDNYFQIIRYGWNSQTPLAVLTDFQEFHVLDCRYKPDPETALNRAVATYHYKEYSDREKFARIYWLFSREGVITGSLERRAAELPKPSGKAVQRGLFPGAYKPVDESFLEELDEFRTDLARAFKAAEPTLDSETLTELTQRTLDRLVFLRFLEDKGIEDKTHVDRFGDRGTVWEDFVAASRRLDAIYNGIVFKEHAILDARTFSVQDAIFGDICERLASVNTPYDFNSIPIHILGSIYERFLGKVIVATAKRARVEEKPEVRKAGGVYYTPEYISRYIVRNTVGNLIAGRTPPEIAKMRFADIACGSGSFLLCVYDLLLQYHGNYYNALSEAETARTIKHGDCIEREGRLYLSLRKKREILLNNIFGVDIDAQAVEVTQLSLFLRLLQDETPVSTHQFLFDFQHVAQTKRLLPDLNKNIVCGNSLIETGILDGQLFAVDVERKLNPMNFEDAFPEVMKAAGFDAIVGNPPYLYSAGRERKEYLESHFNLSEYQTDFYVYFVERAIQILKRGGSLGMIVSDSWIKGKFFTKFREHLLRHTQLDSITVFDYPPFQGAAIENSIIMLHKMPQSETFAIRKFTSSTELVEVNALKAVSCLARGLIDIHQSEAHSRVHTRLEANTCTLISICKLNRGVHAYRTDGYGKSKFSKGKQTKRDKDEQSYHSRTKLDSTFIPEIKGKHLRRYSYIWDGTYISYGEWLAEPRTPEFFFGPKLAIRKIIAPKLICTFIKEDTILDQSIYVAIRDSTEPPDLLFILGILASSVGGWFIQTRYGIYDTLYPWFTKDQLAHFPIPKLDFANSDDRFRHDKLVQKVEAMLEAKQQSKTAKTDKNKTYYGNKCISLDRQIDRLVYDLYGLAEEEIKLIETSESADGRLRETPKSNDDTQEQKDLF